MKRILISGVGGTAALNFVWALKHTDEKLYLVGTDCSRHYVHLARGVDKTYVVPKSNEAEYVEEINEVIEKEAVQFLHAQPDVEVKRISEDREKIRARLFLPDKETVRLCHDKFQLIEHLHERKLPAARNILVNDERDIEVAFKEFGSKIWLRAIEGAGGRGSLPVTNVDHACAWIDYWQGWGSFAAEEYLPGRNMAWQAIYKEGELITSLIWERLEYIISHVSPSGITGTPSVAKIIKNETINEIAVQVAFSISGKPNGIFSMDFKENEIGVPCVTEVNPGRFFTPSFMYVKAGVNLPLIYVKLAFNEPIPKLPKFNAFRKPITWIRGIDVAPVAVEN